MDNVFRDGADFQLICYPLACTSHKVLFSKRDSAARADDWPGRRR